jgi:hypothetical protein
MNKISLLLLSLFIGISLVQSQTFVKTVVVTLKGDTLKGEAQINTKKPLQKFEKIIFRDASGIQKNFKPDKVTSYTLDTDYFISLNQDGEPRFYRVLANGAINLYELGFEMQVGNKIEADVEYYLSYPENKRLVEIKKKKFKKQLADWLKENPDIAAKYTDEEFDAEKAAAVINEFNNWKTPH